MEPWEHFIGKNISQWGWQRGMVAQEGRIHDELARWKVGRSSLPPPTLARPPADLLQPWRCRPPASFGHGVVARWPPLAMVQPMSKNKINYIYKINKSTLLTFKIFVPKRVTKWVKHYSCTWKSRVILLSTRQNPLSQVRRI